MQTTPHDEASFRGGGGSGGCSLDGDDLSRMGNSVRDRDAAAAAVLGEETMALLVVGSYSWLLRGDVLTTR